MARDDGDLVTVRVAARWWKVSRGVVYKWIRRRIVTCFRVGPAGRGRVAARDEVRAAPVLRRGDVQNLGVDPALLERAIRNEVVTPSQGRFSLNDVDAIQAFGATGRTAPAPAAPTRPSGVVLKALEWGAAEDAAWVDRGAHPEELPDGYFDMPAAPEFIGPADLFLFTPGEPVPDRPGARYVIRSAGYERRGGKLVWREQNDRFRVLEPGESLSEYEENSNHEYRLRRARWKREIWLRRRLRRAR